MKNLMLETVQATVRTAAKQLGLSNQQVESFLEAEAVHAYEVEVAGQKFPAFRVQHNSKLGPYKGGIRFRPDVSLEEVQALATLMSLKVAAAGLPLGGGKGGVIVDPRQLSQAELEELSRSYAKNLVKHIGPDKDVPGPDMGTNADIMTWMMDEYETQTGDKTQASFTGKAMERGGSEGREAATGNGGMIALRELLKSEGLPNRPQTIAVQGFGNVGYFFAKALASHPSLKLIAVSNSQHTWMEPAGVDVAALPKASNHLPRPEDLDEFKSAEILPPEAVFGIKADILVLAALEDAVTEKNMRKIKSNIIVELANGPISKTAELYLLKAGKLILPDIIANAGGVIVSYLEWQQNLRGEHWSESQVNQKLEAILAKAVGAVLKRASQKSISLKQAAVELALTRLLA